MCLFVVLRVKGLEGTLRSLVPSFPASSADELRVVNGNGGGPNL